jgi:hypothetical protein
MLTFIALYRGSSVSNAELVTVSSEPGLVREIADRLMARPLPTDPVNKARAAGEREALRLIAERNAAAV